MTTTKTSNIQNPITESELDQETRKEPIGKRVVDTAKTVGGPIVAGIAGAGAAMTNARPAQLRRVD